MTEEDCYLFNENLTSLTTAKIPEIVIGILFIYNNNLENLIGSPKEVGQYINATHNRLRTLYGFPKKIGRGFYFHTNNLMSLDFLSLTIGGHILFI